MPGQKTTMSIVVSQPTIFKQKRPKSLPGETLQEYHRRCWEFRQAHCKKNKPKRRMSERRCPTTEAMRWLQGKVFAHVYGEKVGDAVFPSMTKETFIGFYNER